MSNKRLTPLGGKEKCSCKGYNLDKLLQPNVLILLAKQELHGYLIATTRSIALLLQQSA